MVTERASGVKRASGEGTAPRFNDKRGRWELKITTYDDDGVAKRRMIVATDRDECIAKRNKLIADLANGKITVHVNRNLTVGAYLDDWADALRPTDRRFPACITNYKAS